MSAIYKRVIVTLKVDGTDAQANCIADAIGEPLGEFVEAKLTPLCASESCNASWGITRETWHPPDGIKGDLDLNYNDP